jgi:hypothetical protein
MIVLKDALRSERKQENNNKNDDDEDPDENEDGWNDGPDDETTLIRFMVFTGTEMMDREASVNKAGGEPYHPDYRKSELNFLHCVSELGKKRDDELEEEFLIPYRDSKLTMILANVLQKRCLINCIGVVGPTKQLQVQAARTMDLLMMMSRFFDNE